MGRGFESHRGHQEESQMVSNKPFGFFVVSSIGLFLCHLLADDLLTRELRWHEGNAPLSTMMSALLLRDLADKMLRNEILFRYFQNRKTLQTPLLFENKKQVNDE